MARTRNRTHGMSRPATPEYKSWQDMKSRCRNPRVDSYRHYGGRGISICHRWLHSFENFYEDMGRRPIGHSLDRIDLNGNYEPINCRWATRKEQSRNRTISKKVLIFGEKMGLSEAVERFSCVKYGTVLERIRRGWEIETAIVSPRRK